MIETIVTLFATYQGVGGFRNVLRALYVWAYSEDKLTLVSLVQKLQKHQCSDLCVLHKISW